MNSIDRQPVPLGGSRVPESMGGPSCPPWQELAEQQQQQPCEGFGPACELVLSLREQIGAMKKQLSNLAVPMKAYIYSTAAPDRSAIESALGAVDDAAAAIGSAAAAAAEAAAADPCLPAEVKAEAAKVLNAVRCDVAQQSADSRALCLVTADKADADAAKRQQQQQQQQQQQREQQQQEQEQRAEQQQQEQQSQLQAQQPQGEQQAQQQQAEQQQQQQQQEARMPRPQFAKELYGDFNLLLGPITRRLFAAQTKLLALIKNIKKNKRSFSCEEEETNN
ncbi:hypothetical protein, conserved [Eimeria tenella]|uniref:Uncharacterized protein n=1 Tax=Eimeria tenella TaxID=5802 RepID=U6KUZ6_EIMTE|nr:hypothetical protein, conserved [Eimeria tenella]CDJ39330.1 hypothetical protein, conserved [Eimeria tenella]|eukprot:XP_013230085.1 hypothetical protein, conserved [Eimeria tenella]